MNYLINVGDIDGTTITVGQRGNQIRFVSSGPVGPPGLQGGRVTEVAVDTTLTVLHGVVNVDTSAGPVIITLPLTTAVVDHGFLIRRDGASAVTVNVSGADTFDDATTTKGLNTDSAGLGVISIGDTEWKIVGTQGTVA